MTKRCVLFVMIDPLVVSGQMRGLMQRPLAGNLHFSQMLDPDNANADATVTGEIHMARMIITLNIYHALEGYDWRNIIRVVDGAPCGADVEFGSYEEARRFQMANPSSVDAVQRCHA